MTPLSDHLAASVQRPQGSRMGREMWAQSLLLLPVLGYQLAMLLIRGWHCAYRPYPIETSSSRRKMWTQMASSVSITEVPTVTEYWKARMRTRLHMTPAAHLRLYIHLPAHERMLLHAYQLVRQV